MKFASRNRWIIVAIAHYITILFFTQLNFYIAPFGISVLITGMLLSFSSLTLNHLQGSFSLIPVAFLVDTKTPFPFGSSLLTLIGLHYIAVLVRYQLRRESEGASLATALAANLAIYIVYTFLAAANLGTKGINAFQIAINLLVSSLVIALINLHYQRALIEILGVFGINTAQKQRHSR